MQLHVGAVDGRHGGAGETPLGCADETLPRQGLGFLGSAAAGGGDWTPPPTGETGEERV